MSEPVRFVPRRLLVAVDLSPPADAAITYALSLALSAPVESVEVAAVGAPIGEEIRIESSDGLVTMARRAARALVDTHVRRVASKAGLSMEQLPPVTVHLLEGSPAAAVAELAAAQDIDLIVVGTHGRRGVRRAMLGSVAEQIVRSAGCPVTVVRPKHHAGAPSDDS